jgi:hypothetical protein
VWKKWMWSRWNQQRKQRKTQQEGTMRKLTRRVWHRKHQSERLPSTKQKRAKQAWKPRAARKDIKQRRQTSRPHMWHNRFDFESFETSIHIFEAGLHHRRTHPLAHSTMSLNSSIRGKR